MLQQLFGYIIGIIMGLYCKISIAFLYLFLLFIYLLSKPKKEKIKFKLISIKRYSRYIKIIFTKKVIFIIVISSIISNSIVLFQNYKYKNLYKDYDKKLVQISGIIVKQNKNYYILKVLTPKYKNTYLLVRPIEENNKELQCGNEVLIIGEFTLPAKQRNYKGFDYENYLKKEKVYGVIKIKGDIKILKNSEFNFVAVIEKIKVKIENRIEELSLSNVEKEVLKAFIIGEKDFNEQKIMQVFSKANLAHILAISGMHIMYIIIFFNFLLYKIIGRHYSKIGISLVIIIYMVIIGFTPSITRAGIVGILSIISNFFYRKSDTFQNLSFSLLIMLIYNPFLIQDTGLQLSFFSIMGIIIFPKILKTIYNEHLERIKNIAIRKNLRYKKAIIKVLEKRIIKKIIELNFVAISVNFMILPIIMVNFNKINITNFFSGILAEFIVGPIMIIGIISIFFNINIFTRILSFFICFLLKIAEFGSNMPFAQINCVTPSIFQIFLYYILLFGFMFLLKIYFTKNVNLFQKRIKNLISLLYYKVNLNKNRIISTVLIFFILFVCYKIIPKDLKIYFIDVGQGDSTLIVTPNQKSILIDGGGVENSNFDIRKKHFGTIFIR